MLGMRRLTSLWIAALVLAGCAGGTDDPSPASAPASVAADAAANTPVDPTASSRARDPREGGLELGFGEWAITLEADAIRPGPVTLVVRNGGTMLHGFEIEADDGDDDHSGSGHGGLKFEGPGMAPGETVRLEMDLPAGTYTIECFVDGHDDMGMETTLVVRPDAPHVREERATDGAVAIADFAFAPVDVEVPAGTEVVWSNEDPTAHTVTADDGAFDSGTLDPAGTFRAVLEREGTLRYRCLIHPSMQGTITVVGP